MQLNIPLQKLEVRRTVFLLCLFYRYVYDDKSHYLPLQRAVRTSRHLHNSQSFLQVSGKTKTYYSSEFRRAVALWNSLSNRIATFTNREDFREKLQSLFQ